MKLSTGKTAIKVPFDNGDVGVVYININDRSIHERLKAFQGNVEKKIKEINLDQYKANIEGANNISLNNIDDIFDLSKSDLMSLDSRVEAINAIEHEYNCVVCKEIDEVFASPVSDVFFRYCQPFDVVVVEDKDGKETREMYIMHFLKWFANELKKNAEKNASAVNKHIGKYID